MEGEYYYYYFGELTLINYTNYSGGNKNGKVKRKGRAFKHASKKVEILTKWKNGEFN